jgi:hypothetical protein
MRSEKVSEGFRGAFSSLAHVKVSPLRVLPAHCRPRDLTPARKYLGKPELPKHQFEIWEDFRLAGR